MSIGADGKKITPKRIGLLVLFASGLGAAVRLLVLGGNLSF